MLKYKLTDQNNKTYNNTLWGKNITHTTDGSGDLCSSGWLHFYHSPELAILMNPIFGNIKNPKLWECEALGSYLDDSGLKGGCTSLTTIREITLPEITNRQRVRFAILCAKEVYHDKEWNEWADEYYSSGLNIDIAYTADFAYRTVEFGDASTTAFYAARAANAYAYAPAAAYIASAAYVASAAAYASKVNTTIDFQSLVKKALDNGQ